MPTTQDTEITLGTGKMLALFFALVALCAVFFGMGYKMGKAAAPAAMPGETMAVPAASNPGVRPSAVKANAGATPAADVAFYKSGAQNSASGSKNTASDTQTTAAADNTSDAKAPPDQAVASQNGYFVQVAAVSKQEDGEALVDALKKKQYPAFAASGPDKLFHVQVGPFSDVKSAEDMRAKLVNDGYNPILKK